MPARRTYGAAALLVGASGLLLTCVFGFLSFVPGIDPAMADFFKLAFFAGGFVTIAGLAGYFLLSRSNAGSGEPLARFDRALDQKKAALGAIPIGLIAVAIGALWFVIKSLGGGAALGVTTPQHFNEFDTPGIIAFLGFGSLYVAIGTYMTIRAERAALRSAREDAGVIR